MLLNLILLFIIFLLLIILSFVWPPDSPWAPWWRTTKKTAKIMCRLAKMDEKDVVFDLGCGDGSAVITAAKDFKARAVGIEIDPLRFLAAKLRVKLNKVSDKVKIIKDNFNNQDLSEATIIFVYLVPRALERLKPKLLKELKKGTLIVSYRYKISLPLNYFDEKNNIYLYRIP